LKRPKVKVLCEGTQSADGNLRAVQDILPSRSNNGLLLREPDCMPELFLAGSRHVTTPKSG